MEGLTRLHSYIVAITLGASVVCIVLVVAAKVCRRLRTSFKAARGRRKVISVRAAVRENLSGASPVVAGPGIGSLDQTSALPSAPGAALADIVLIKGQRATKSLTAASMVASPVKIHQTPWRASSEGEVGPGRRGGDDVRGDREEEGEVSSDDSEATVQTARTRGLQGSPLTPSNGGTAQDEQAVAKGSPSVGPDGSDTPAREAAHAWLEMELYRSAARSPPLRRPTSRALWYGIR